MLAIFRYPSADALEIARAEEIFEQTLQIIHDQVNEGHTNISCSFIIDETTLVITLHLYY
jgi:hypothetical protein